MNKPRRVQISYNGDISHGWFHKWGHSSITDKDPQTVAIVELESGQITMINPFWIKFVHPGTSD